MKCDSCGNELAIVSMEAGKPIVWVCDKCRVETVCGSPAEFNAFDLVPPTPPTSALNMPIVPGKKYRVASFVTGVISSPIDRIFPSRKMPQPVPYCLSDCFRGSDKPFEL